MYHVQIVYSIKAETEEEAKEILLNEINNNPHINSGQILHYGVSRQYDLVDGELKYSPQN